MMIINISIFKFNSFEKDGILIFVKVKSMLLKFKKKLYLFGFIFDIIKQI